MELALEQSHICSYPFDLSWPSPSRFILHFINFARFADVWGRASLADGESI